MKRIGLLSDTHAYWDDRYLKHFAGCDEVWHAGDIGCVEIIQKFRNFTVLRAVYGNIDGEEVRRECPRDQRFSLEGVDVWMTHIGGYPPNYDREVKKALLIRPPKLFVCGHSHILKVKYDKTLGLLHINPGAAGKQGWQTVRSLVRFVLDEGNIGELEVIELAE